MLKMRFMSNAVLATASLDLMKEYADFLCGDQVWSYVVKGGDGLPLTCPHIGLVRNYDYAIRLLQHRLTRMRQWQLHCCVIPRQWCVWRRGPHAAN